MPKNEESKDLEVQGTKELVTQTDAPMGFEDEEAGDMIIPRVKVIQTLSPERKDGIAEEGDILNSLTKEKLNGKKFIAVFKYNNNIEWKPRSEGGGIKCYSSDGKTGKMSDGTLLVCAQCKRNEFDNSKTGAESLPKCTKYMNFFGFFEGERMPIILSFAKTNYAEGKKLFSLAKVSMQNMWHFAYTLCEKKMVKGGNEWYNAVVTPAGPTSNEDREFGKSMFMSFRDTDFKADLDDDSTSKTVDASTASDEELKNTEF